MQLKERYTIVDYTNHSVMFIGDSLQEVKEWMIISAEENENDVEEVKRLPLDRNKIYNFLHENHSYELEWQDAEEYTAD